MTGQEAQASYDFGYRQGKARRTNTRPTANVPPQNLSSFWFDVGDTDGASGRGRRAFDSSFSYAYSEQERVSYEDGFNGNSSPRFDGYDAWFAAGKEDRAAGRAKDWAIKSVVAPTGGPRTAPVYQPKNNPNAASLPPVVVKAPTGGGVNQPDVVVRPAQSGPVPPWMWQPGMGSGSGIIIYGDGYYIDLNKLQNRR